MSFALVQSWLMEITKVNRWGLGAGVGMKTLPEQVLHHCMLSWHPEEKKEDDKTFRHGNH